MSHYSKATTDILYRYPHGLEELEGIANRTDFDLGSHTKNQDEFNIKARVVENNDSVAKLNMTSPDKESFIPFVIEPSCGLDRGVLALITDAYTKETLPDGKERIVLKLKHSLAPIKVAVIPLARNNEQIVTLAKDITQQLQQLGLGRVKYEDTGNIGKAYRRNDEVGTPLCVTIDFESIESSDPTVTIRHRDTCQQDKIQLSDLILTIRQFYSQSTEKNHV